MGRGPFWPGRGEPRTGPSLLPVVLRRLSPVPSIWPPSRLRPERPCRPLGPARWSTLSPLCFPPGLPCVLPCSATPPLLCFLVSGLAPDDCLQYIRWTDGACPMSCVARPWHFSDGRCPPLPPVLCSAPCPPALRPDSLPSAALALGVPFRESALAVAHRQLSWPDILGFLALRGGECICH